MCTHRQTGGWGKSPWNSPGCGGCGCACVHPRWLQATPCEPRSSWCSEPYSSARDRGSHSDCQLQRDGRRERGENRKHNLSRVKGTFIKENSRDTTAMVISFVYEQLARAVGNFQAHVGIVCFKIHVTGGGVQGAGRATISLNYLPQKKFIYRQLPFTGLEF